MYEYEIFLRWPVMLGAESTSLEAGDGTSETIRAERMLTCKLNEIKKNIEGASC